MFEVESVIYELATELYDDSADPMPAFQYFGGDYGQGLLESALTSPMQTFQGRWLHRTIFDKAAALFRSIIKNHSLVDGNKRLALTSVAVFLRLNGYLLRVSGKRAVAFSLRVAATHGNFELAEIARWLRRYSIRI
ncbi:MAG: type II toxin-antitoxin system death-on-curing family toxin [Chloroflexi bacterium]|nr:type II toxin-antitoxin system death-on-curing family toxin [Chloroflexota bacterium]